MNDVYIPAAAVSLVPSAKFRDASSYERLVATWTDARAIPTEAEIAAEIVNIMAGISANAYKGKRSAEYPPMADYLDAVAKGDAVQQQAYIDACLAIKLKYPKGI